jgi:hypothetical protein
VITLKQPNQTGKTYKKLEREITAFGHINGQGQMQVYNRDKFASGLGVFENTNIEIIVRERAYSFKDPYRNYYFGVIVKQAQLAFRNAGYVKSQRDTDYFLRDLYLYEEIYNEETGGWEKTALTLKKNDTTVTGKQMREYCEICIIYVMQALSWAIPYPNEELDNEDFTPTQRGLSPDKNLNTF